MSQRYWFVCIAISSTAACSDDGSAFSEDGGPSPCVGGQFCVGELVCVDGFCVEPGTDETGDGDGDSTDGDGDPPGDGDGDPSGDGDGERSVVSVAVGGVHSCVLFDDGGVRCWGGNEQGQLGIGSTERLGDEPGEMPPDDLDVGGPATSIVAGYEHTCALLESGEVRCWGGNAQGQLGVGNTDNLGDGPGEMPPPPVGISGTVSQLHVGSGQTCVVLDDGGVRCWGLNHYGQLGDPSYEPFGDTPDETSPPLLDIGGPVAKLGLGLAHGCAIIQGGQVRCWGDSSSGAHGYEHDGYAGLPPDDVNLDQSAAVDIDGGRQHTCAVFEGGGVRCWGQGIGLGIGSPQSLGDDPGEMPPPLTTVGGAVDRIWAGNLFSCALLSAGAIRCWGTTYGGVLGLPGGDGIGDGPGEMPPDDMVLGGPAELGGVASTSEHLCAITDGADVRCWGVNNVGQLGQGHTEFIGDDPGEMPPPIVPVL